MIHFRDTTFFWALTGEIRGSGIQVTSDRTGRRWFHWDKFFAPTPRPSVIDKGPPPGLQWAFFYRERTNGTLRLTFPCKPPYSVPGYFVTGRPEQGECRPLWFANAFQVEDNYTLGRSKRIGRTEPGKTIRHSRRRTKPNEGQGPHPEIPLGEGESWGFSTKPPYGNQGGTTDLARQGTPKRGPLPSGWPDESRLNR